MSETTMFFLKLAGIILAVYFVLGLILAVYLAVKMAIDKEPISPREFFIIIAMWAVGVYQILTEKRD